MSDLLSPETRERRRGMLRTAMGPAIALALEEPDVVEVMVEVVELTAKGRLVRLSCEARVDGRLVLDGEALVSVPGRPKGTSAHT